MKFSLVFAVLTASSSAYRLNAKAPKYTSRVDNKPKVPSNALYPHDWIPAGEKDVRGPCPMLNSLANHRYLPHSGKNITLNQTIDALSSSLNIDEELSTFLFGEATTTNPVPNATTFSLSDLVRHNILEHDASLSRVDYSFGDPQPFNQTIFDQTRSYWTEPVIDVQQAANARYARVQTSIATNPTYSMSELGEEFGYGETAAYVIMLGDKETGTVNRTWVEYLFENERLPFEVGWSRRNGTISTSDLENMMQQIMAATPGGMQNMTGPAAKRATMHNARLGKL